MPSRIIDDGKEQETVGRATVDVEKIAITFVSTLLAKVLFPSSGFGGSQRNHVHMAKDC